MRALASYHATPYTEPTAMPAGERSAAAASRYFASAYQCDDQNRSQDGNGNRTEAAESVGVKSKHGLLPVAVGIAGHGSLAAVPGVAGREFGFFPAEIGLALLRTPLLLQNWLDRVKLAVGMAGT